MFEANIKVQRKFFEPKVRAEIDASRKLRAVMKLEPLTRFSRAELEDLYDDFRSICAPSKIDALTGSATAATGLDKRAFADFMAKYIVRWDANAFLLDRIFAIFDINGDGLLDFDELMRGSSLFLRGTKAEKTQLCIDVVNTAQTDPLPLGVVREMLQQVAATVHKETSAVGAAELQAAVTKMLEKAMADEASPWT
jgi:hypothetical protein